MQRFSVLRNVFRAALPVSALRAAESGCSLPTSNILSLSQRCWAGYRGRLCATFTTETEVPCAEKDDSAGHLKLPDEKNLEVILSKVNQNIGPIQVCQVMTWLATSVPLEKVWPLVHKVNAFVDGKSLPRPRASKLAGEDEMFYLFRSMASSKVGNMETMGIVSCLKATSTLGLTSSNSFAVVNMQNALTWRARTCTMSDLTLLLSFVYKRKNELAKENVAVPRSTELLYQEVVRSIERRWVEVDEGKILVRLLHYYPEVFGEKFAVQLEDRSLEIAGQLSVDEMVSLLKTLASKKRRTVSLLRAITYHLIKRTEGIGLKSLADALYAMKQLSFKNLEAWETFCQMAENDLSPSSRPAIVRSILTSVGQARFLHKGLLDKIAEHLSQRVESESLENLDMLQFLLTTATLNYLPKGSQAVYNAIINRLTKSSLATDNEEKADLAWLNVVWSLTVLGKATPSHFESVLSSDFYNKILYSQNHQSNVGAILKILNVNAAATFCHRDYTGPKIHVADDPLLRDVRCGQKSDKAQLVKHVMVAMRSLASTPTHLALDVNTLMGFVVEGEAVFSKNLKPLPIERHALFATAGGERNSLPPGASRVAVMVVGYSDCLFGEGQFGGLTDLCKRLLEANSVHVLLVRHTDISQDQKSLDRIKLLDKRLRLVLKPETQPHSDDTT